VTSGPQPSDDVRADADAEHAIVGVDTHKDFHVAAVINMRGVLLASRAFPPLQPGTGVWWPGSTASVLCGGPGWKAPALTAWRWPGTCAATASRWSKSSAGQDHPPPTRKDRRHRRQAQASKSLWQSRSERWTSARGPSHRRRTWSSARRGIPAGTPLLGQGFRIGAAGGAGVVQREPSRLSEPVP
jgi:hypothetical protein